MNYKEYKKYLFRFSYPIIISAIFMTLANVATNIIISYLGESELIAKNIYSTYNSLYLAFNAGFALMFASYYSKYKDDKEKQGACLKISTVVIGVISIIIMILFILFRDMLFKIYSTDSNVLEISNIYSIIRSLSFPIIGLQAFFTYVLSHNHRKRILVGNIVALVLEIVLVTIVTMYTDLGMPYIALIEVLSRLVKLIMFVIPFISVFKNRYINNYFATMNVKKVILNSRNILFISIMTFVNVIIGMALLKIYVYIDYSKFICITISNDVINITSNLFVAIYNIITTEISTHLYDKKEKKIIKEKIKYIRNYILNMFFWFILLTIITGYITLRLYNIDNETYTYALNIIIIRCILYLSIPLTILYTSLYKIFNKVKSLFLVDTVVDILLLIIILFIYRIFETDLLQIILIYNILLIFKLYIIKKKLKFNY